MKIDYTEIQWTANVTAQLMLTGLLFLHFLYRAMVSLNVF